MRGDSSKSRRMMLTAILALAMVLGLGLLAGPAHGQTTTATVDYLAPLVVNIDANDAGAPAEAFVEAEFVDIGVGIEEGTEALTVPDAAVSECVKTKFEDKRKIKCKVSNLGHGEHEVTASAKDKAGNYSQRRGQVRIEDTAAPVIDSIETDSGNVTVYFHDPDPSSGIASVSIAVDGTPLVCCACERHKNGMGAYLGEGHNDCGHKEVNGVGHYVDENHAVIDSNVFPPPDDYSPWPGSTDFTCDLPGLPCGPHEVVVTITDKAGHTTTQSKVFQVGDCTPPVTTDDAPDGWQNTDVTVTLSCDDGGGSGCATTTYEVDGGDPQTGNTVTLTTSGEYTITYHSTDNAGNVEDTRTATVRIDKMPPEITTSGDATVEASGPAGATASYTAEATDAHSGLASLECIPASGSTFPIYPVGTTAVSCTAVDHVGNTSISTFDITVEDTRAPVVTYGGPEGGSPPGTVPGTVITDGDPVIIGTATDAVGVVSAEMKVDDGGWIPCEVVGDSVSCPTAGLSFGWHDIEIRAQDAAGNEGTTGLIENAICKSSGAPYLDIVCTGYGYGWVWETPTSGYYLIGAYYQFSSDVDPGAYNAVITAQSAALNGTTSLQYVGYTLNPPPLNPSVLYMYDPDANSNDVSSPRPITVGNVLTGAPVDIVIWYRYVGYGSLETRVTACADDQCGNTYFEAPVDPVG